MNWFRRHLNCTLISVWLGGGLLLFVLEGVTTSTPSSADFADNLKAYQDKTCSTPINSVERPDFQWMEAKQEGWQETIWTVYLRNEGNTTIEVSASATKDPMLAIPGWSVSSETVRLKPGESAPLPIEMSYNPFFVTSTPVYYQINTVVTEDPVSWYYIFYLIFWIATVYCTAGWVLKQKDRSLWWLALLGLGIIATLFLKNRSYNVEVKLKNKEKA